MSFLSLALAAVGLVIIAFAAWRGRAPYRRLKELDRLVDNARRYESWRGGRKTAAGAESTTGADVMRAVLRRQLRSWLAVGAAGGLLVIAAFVVG